jgi:hypothetical protein
MSTNLLLGKLVSTHKLADYRRSGLTTCGCFLIFPFIFGLWGVVASLTYARQTSDASLGFYFSLGLAATCLGLFGLFALVSRLSPAWLKKYELKIYENGFVKKDLFKSQTCLWSEIREVNPKLLVYDKASLNMPPSEFSSLGEDTKQRGIYEVYKRDGSKIIVSRKYAGVERLDEQLVRFCKATPNW